MTCIAAIRTPNSILMGGDSAASTDTVTRIISATKVFVDGDYIFGLAGSVRIAQIVRYGFHSPLKIQEMDWLAFMVSIFVEELKKQTELRSLGDSSTLIVGTKGGGIFVINSELAVGQSRDGFEAAGSGLFYALGALHGSSGDPRERLQAALEAAAYFDPFVRPPFTILELPEEGLHERLAGTFETMEDRSTLFTSDPNDRGDDDGDGREIGDVR